MFFFSFRVDSLSEGTSIQESNKVVTKVVSLVKYGGKSTKCIHVS